MCSKRLVLACRSHYVERILYLGQHPAPMLVWTAIVKRDKTGNEVICYGLEGWIDGVELGIVCFHVLAFFFSVLSVWGQLNV